MAASQLALALTQTVLMVPIVLGVLVSLKPLMILMVLLALLMLLTVGGTEGTFVVGATDGVGATDDTSTVGQALTTCGAFSQRSRPRIIFS